MNGLYFHSTICFHGVQLTPLPTISEMATGDLMMGPEPSQVVCIWGVTL